jgi:hypothetical protein
VPDISLKLNLPLALTADHPLQVGIASPLFTIDPSVLQLREMAFEEADLVLIRGTGDIGGGSLDREVVVYSALVYGFFRLGNELCSPHIRVPLRSVVNGDLGTLLRAGIGGILEAGREVDVFGDCSGAVDVVLVVSNLVGP